MSQLLLMPDPRPLVEKLGASFFKSAPGSPGVYLMRDASRVVLYVGKARDLRKRLCSYRVANPDRMRKRQLRLLGRVASIDLEICASEDAALRREAELIGSLKPKFNRAGTWQGPERFLLWRAEQDAVILGIGTAPGDQDQHCGPIGTSAIHVRAALARLLWISFNPGQRISALPPGWFSGRHAGETRVRARSSEQALSAALLVGRIFDGRVADFQEWVRECCGDGACPFDDSVRNSDIEYLETAAEAIRRKSGRQSVRVLEDGV